MKPKELVPIIQDCKLGEFPGFYWPNLPKRCHVENHLIVETFWNATSAIVQVDLETGHIEKIGDSFNGRPHSFFLLDVDPETKLICAYLMSPVQQPAIVIKKTGENEWKLVDDPTKKNDKCKWDWQVKPR